MGWLSSFSGGGGGGRAAVATTALGSINVDAVLTRNVTQTGVPAAVLADGLTLVAGTSTVLCVAQTSAINNGVFTVQSGAWTRVTLTAGMNAIGSPVFVKQGRRHLNTKWECRGTSSVLVGTDAQVWRATATPTGWLNLWDIDGTVGPPQTLNADGDYTTPDGTVLTKFNTAQEASPMTIGNANGWQIQPTAGRIYDAATRTVPGVTINPFTYFPDLSFGSRLRLYWRILSVTGVGAADGWLHGIEARAGSNGFAKFARSGCGGANEGVYLKYINSAVTQFNGAVRGIPVVANSHGVHCLEMTVGSPEMLAMVWGTSTFVSDWPAENVMSGIGGYAQMATATQNAFFDGFVHQNTRVVVAAVGTTVLKINNFRCDVRL